MTHPKNSYAYEDIFPLIMENLSRAQKSEYVLNFKNEKDATKMRLRWYSYTKVYLREAQEKMASKIPELQLEGQSMKDRWIASKKYLARLEPGGILKFVDRDSQYADISNQLMQDLMGDVAQEANKPHQPSASDLFESMLGGGGALTADLPREIPKNPMED